MSKDEDLELAGFLVELDVLLDTRLSVFYKEGIEKPFDDFHKEYFKRDQDKFKYLPDFKDLYEERDVENIKNALMTNFIDVVIEYAEKVDKQNKEMPLFVKPCLMINIYPYQLDEVSIETIIKSFVIITEGLCDVQVVNMSYEDITPTFVKEKVSMMALYRYDIWLELHSKNKNFEKVTCPEVALLGPAIYFKDKPKQVTEDPFASLQFLASPLVGLTLLPISYFCIKVKGLSV